MLKTRLSPAMFLQGMDGSGSSYTSLSQAMIQRKKSYKLCGTILLADSRLISLVFSGRMEIPLHAFISFLMILAVWKICCVLSMHLLLLVWSVL